MNLWIALGSLLLGIVLVFWAVMLTTRRSVPGDSLNGCARFFLVALRLAIGWHFLFEGLDKLQSPNWSSEVYLRESVGPLGPTFRKLAGDTLVAKLTPGEKSLSPELEKEWQRYFDAFVGHYELDEEQKKSAKNNFDLMKADTLTWITTEKKDVAVLDIYPPTEVPTGLTIVERLQLLRELQGELDAMQKNEMDAERKNKFSKYVAVKGALSKWRAELKSDLDDRTALMKETILLKPTAFADKLDDLKKKETKKKEEKKKEAKDAKIEGWSLAKVKPDPEPNPFLSKADPDSKTVLTKAQLDKGLPKESAPPVGDWTMLDWSNASVKYGLVAVGGLLILGLFSRLAALLGAVYLLMFFLAMPPLPWFPENPKAEGHYLYINKNIIEMLALLTLASLPTGRWVGVDALIALVFPGRQSRAASGTM